MSVRTTRPKLFQSTHQEPYIRGRDDPFFEGMRRSPLTGSPCLLEFQKNVPDESIAVNIYENTIFSPSRTSPQDTTMEPPHTPFEKLSNSKCSSPSSPNTVVYMNSEFEEEVINSTPVIETEESHMLSNRTSFATERSYNVKRKENDLQIPLPPSAASFYIGDNPQIEIAHPCEGITRLNIYLREKKDEVNSGVPGKFLHVVLGQDLPDIGSVASTIMYAFYLNETLGNSHLCSVPVINMKRADFDSHAELKWLLDSCCVDHSLLIFINEIDLSYYDLFGSLQLVLLNGDRLPPKQEVLKEALVEIFNCKKEDTNYPWVHNITVGQDCSCCTLIAEKFLLTSPQLLAEQGFSRLLLAGILLDTGNFTNAEVVDKYMATLLLNGAGRYGCNGLYQILRYKMHDVSNLKIKDILKKDFKKWTRVGKPESTGSRLVTWQFGMSSIGMPIEQLLAQGGTSIQEIANFMKLEKLRLLIVVSGYYDSQKKFKREILVYSEYQDIMENLLFLFKSSSSQLPLKVLHMPGVGEEMKAFEIDRVISRKTIERVLEDFGTTPK